MKDKEMPICVNCFHAYVCEEYNLNRDMLRKRCAYHNDHFLDIEQYKKQIRKETAEKILKETIRISVIEGKFVKVDDLIDKIEELAKQYGVKIKEN